MTAKQSPHHKTTAKGREQRPVRPDPGASSAPKSQRRPTKQAPRTAREKKGLSTAAGSEGDKGSKGERPKLVRDSFTIPESEYAVLRQLKQRAMTAGAPGKKSEILRAGVIALSSMTEQAFRTAMARVQSIKTGRPGKSVSGAS